MSGIEGSLKRRFYIYILSTLIILAATQACHAQVRSCEDSISSVRNYYEKGEWSSCKESALRFIASLKSQDDDLIISRFPAECKNNIPEVYFYLIKSFLRLYDPEQARHYYFEALRKEFNIDFGEPDNEVLSGFGRQKNSSFSITLASISPNFKKYRILNDFKLGAVYGFGQNSYLEISYVKRTFIHNSAERPGLFGKPLKASTAFPYYSFMFRGDERLAEATYVYKKPIYQDNRSLNYLYFSGGAFANYIIKNNVRFFQIREIKSATSTRDINPQGYARRYASVPDSNIPMDLNLMYKERFNYGVFLGYGSTTRLSTQWELSLEGRLTVGRNYTYRYTTFKDYKVGVDNFTILVYLTRRSIKIKETRPAL